MKKSIIVVLVLAIILTLVNVSIAADRVATLDKTLQIKENGVLVRNEKDTTRLLIPNVAGSDELQRLRRELLGTKKKLGAIGELKEKMDEAITNAKTAAVKSEAVVQELTKVPEAIGSNTTAIKNLQKELGRTGDQTVDYIRRGELIFGGLLLLGLITILVVLWLSRWKGGEHDQKIQQELESLGGLSRELTQNLAADLADARNAIITAVQKSQEEIGKELNNIPIETKRLIKEFDPTPFEFDVSGHHVVCDSAADGFYWTLKVEEMPNGENNPATFKRQADDKRWRAEKYIKGAMKKFFEGTLKGTSQGTLIAYLRDVTRDIKYRKKD